MLHCMKMRQKYYNVDCSKQDWKARSFPVAFLYSTSQKSLRLWFNWIILRNLIHQELQVHGAFALMPVVFNPLGPGCALNVDQDSRGGVLQLDHDDGLQVA